MKRLLTLKHWQLFSVIVVPPVLFSSNSLGNIAAALSGLVLLAWLYSIGFYGQRAMAASGLKAMNLRLFQVNIIVIPASLMLSKAFFYFRIDLPPVFAMLFGIFSGFAALQVLVFVSKSLAKLESHREVSFSDYLQNFFLFLLFFAGIWSLQPRINRLFT